MQDVDHILYAVPDLARGMDEIERRLGVRPAIGGRHPKYGTHNALLSLGPTTYLEVIAPDPGNPNPVRGLPFGMKDLREPRLATWILRTDRIDELADAAAGAGVDLGEIETGHRETTEDTVLSWRASDPYADRFGGAVPFLIDWGTTPHPAGAAPAGGDLVGLRIEHPSADRVRAVLAALGARLEVKRARLSRVVATIRTPSGDLELA